MELMLEYIIVQM